MAGAGIAINAAMLAAAIGVNGAVKGNIRRVDVIDDATAGINGDFGFKRRQGFVQTAPAIIQ
jgi:hypothetical protein